MYTADVHVALKKTVVDPQSHSVEETLKQIGFESIRDVTVGKHFRIELDACSAEEARELVEQMCKQLLANPVIEEYEFELSPSGGVSR